MSEAESKKIIDWNRIVPVSESVLASRVSAIHFRRILREAMRGEACSDLCQNPADVVLKEVPATLVLKDGRKIVLPNEIDTEHLESALVPLHFTREQIRYLANMRRRLALCMECAKKRIANK